MKLPALVVVAAAVLAAPSVAAASTAQVSGERVAVTGSGVDLVLERRGSDLSVVDRAGPLTAGDGCRQVDAGEALCPLFAERPKVTTGAGDDRISLVDQPAVVATGAGDDVVRARGEGVYTSGVDVACGTGADRLERARQVDDVSGCERIYLFGRRVRLALLSDGRLLVTPLAGCACRKIAVVVREQSIVAAGSRSPARAFTLLPRRRWPRWGTVSVWLDGRNGGGLVLRLR